MRPEFMSGSGMLEVIWSLIIFIAAILVALIIIYVLRKFQEKLFKRLRNNFFPKLMGSLFRPIFIIITCQALVYALSLLTYFDSWQANFGKMHVVLLIVTIAYTLTKIVVVLLDWYSSLRNVRSKAQIDKGLVSLVRRSSTLIIYTIAVLVILEFLTINVTPIIASLGIGGLAIALALQPTLANFFAGTQIISDKVVHVGDYIELENSQIRGYVTDVGWRSTRIRTPYNNMIVIPNSRLSDSILTNYQEPNSALGIVVSAGVSYNSDLKKVERIGLEVANEVVRTVDGAATDFPPSFGYEAFGESNINFWLWVQATDRMSSFMVKSELIKQLKERFDKEGIVINYPTRNTFIHWSRDDAPPDFPKAR